MRLSGGRWRLGGVLVLVLLGGWPEAQAELALDLEAVPFDAEHWDLAEAEGALTQHAGRSSLHLEGGMAILQGVDLRNGVVEVDVALPDARSFVGVAWRRVSPGDYEHFYLRPHQSGNPDACQYTPVFNGLTGWQLYAGSEHAAPIVFDQEWTRVRIVFWEHRARIYVNGGEPKLVIHELKHDVRKGQIGLSVPASFASAWFSRFRFGHLDASPYEEREVVEPNALVEPGTVFEWSVSQTFAEDRLEGRSQLDSEDLQAQRWTKLEAESTGLLNLARLQGIHPGADTCFARISVTSEQAQSVPVAFGFSDRVKVYLNRRLLYAGDNTYASRDYRFLGTIGTFDQLALPLVPGANELVFAVSESFGGWGLMARFAEDAEVSLDTP